MPKRNDDYHGGGSGWRFSWRTDRLQKLHELGRSFELTEDSQRQTDPDDQEPEPREPSPE